MQKNNVIYIEDHFSKKRQLNCDPYDPSEYDDEYIRSIIVLSINQQQFHVNKTDINKFHTNWLQMLSDIKVETTSHSSFIKVAVNEEGIIEFS